MKKILAIVMATLLLVLNVLPAAAIVPSTDPMSYEEIGKAISIVDLAVDDLEGVFTPEEAMSITEMFNTMTDAFKSVGSIVAPINGSVTFLKLIGVMKDNNVEMLKSIMMQMQTISEQLSEIDRKLDNITDQMAQMQASIEMKERTNQALAMESAWRSFDVEYCETGLDQFISDYNAMVLNGMKAWCTSTDASVRKEDGVDNSQLILVYEKTADGYSLVYTKDNVDPASLPADARYVVLKSDMLPGTISWNVNTYQQNICNAIKTNIQAKENDGSYVYDAKNFTEFENNSGYTEDLLQTVSQDALNLLTYRIAATKVNKDAKFSLDVQKLFNNYSLRLLESGNGLDAMIESLYLTHAFEYQVKDELTAFCNQMIVKTGVYGSFVMNVLGMSDFITEGEKWSTMRTYCNDLKMIESCISNGLTGKDNYCYLTNSLVYFGNIDFNTVAKIKTTTSGHNLTYKSSSIDPTNISISYGRRKYSAVKEDLIGDSDMQLINMMLHNNGQETNFAYYNQYLGEGAQTNYNNSILKVDGESAYPMDCAKGLAVTNCIGSYFAKSTVTRIDKLPGHAEGKYVTGRRRVTGTMMVTDSGSMASSSLLTAVATYGESHWYWGKDEAAFMGGPLNNAGFTHSVEKIQDKLEFPSTYYYTHKYVQNLRYNCFVEKPFSRLSVGTGINPLANYKALYEEIPQDPDNAPPAEEEKGTSAGKKSPETGDAMILWMFISLTVLLSVLQISKKRRKVME